MASIYDLKPKFQNLLRPIVLFLANNKVTANQVTLLALGLSVLGGSLITFYPTQTPLLLLIPVILFIRMALNAIDGMLAREHNMKTSLGAILNELSDVLSDAALYLPLAFIIGIDPRLVVIVVFLALLSEMTGVIAVQIGAQRRYEGPMGKSDRAFVIGLVALLLGAGVSPQFWVNYVLMGMTILLGVTIINRVRRALEEVA